MPLLAIALMLVMHPVASAASSLPDDRAYELVSPVQKSGGIGGVFPLGSLTHSLEQFGRPLQSSAEGNAISYLGEDFYQPRLGSLNQYLSQRDSGGWSTQNLTLGAPSTARPAIEVNLDVGFSPDLSLGIVSLEGGIEGGLEVYGNLYVDRHESLEALITGKPPDRTPESFGYANHAGQPIVRQPRFAGSNSGSANVPPSSHILFEANDRLTINAKDGGEKQNNLYEWSNGRLQLVNILPGMQEGDPNASFGVTHNDEYSGVVPSLSNVISNDGSKIFWTDENNNNLYVREDGERTTQVDASVGGGGQFQTASVDGSRVFFTKLGHLYEYHTDSGVTEDLAAGGGVEGLVGTSDDGTYVYFVSSSILANGAASAQPNLYLSHNGVLNFIGTLNPGDNTELPSIYGTNDPYGDWYRTFAGRTARVSPNGRYLAFTSKSSLTGYDNADAHLVAKDFEVFLYDANTGTLVCASCNVNGSRPTANTWLPAPVNGVYQQRYLVDSGRLFFSTVDAVLPEDTNGTSDVYEYENGHVYLISPGNVSDEAVFADASESGNDVFFTTRQQLARADQDQIVDLYDARVGGRTEELPPPPCSGEACRSLPVVAPSFEIPPSSVFVGVGNLTPSLPKPTHAPLSKKKKTAPRKPIKKRRTRRHGKHASRASKRSGDHGKP